jgi:hypothetical protein
MTGRSRHRMEGNSEIGLEERGMKIWIGFMWLRIGTSGRLF